MYISAICSVINHQANIQAHKNIHMHGNIHGSGYQPEAWMPASKQEFCISVIWLGSLFLCLYLRQKKFRLFSVRPVFMDQNIIEG